MKFMVIFRVIDLYVSHMKYMAERVGFEPTAPRGIAVFKSGNGCCRMVVCGLQPTDLQGKCII